MRSGSTLLKALLGHAEDVSHIAEVKYRKLGNSFYYVYRQVYSLAPQRILVLKQPAKLDLSSDRFHFKRRDVKVIVLIRSPIDVVNSIKRTASESKFFSRKVEIYETREFYEYWYVTYRDILEDISSAPSRAYIVFYEDLVENPVAVTEKLFRFIGSRQSKGVADYTEPDSGAWKWGTDDGSKLIASGSVRRKTANSENGISISHAIQEQGVPPELCKKIADLWQHYILLSRNIQISTDPIKPYEHLTPMRRS